MFTRPIEPTKTVCALLRTQGRRWNLRSACLLALLMPVSPRMAIGSQPTGRQLPVVRKVEHCDLSWNSPSTDSFGSMPLGNGDVGANVWLEANGDLLLYLSKVDAYDSEHRLPKLGRVRLRMTPALSTNAFEQRLALRHGVVVIRDKDRELRVWVDANHPVVRITGSSDRDFSEALISFETLRDCIELNDSADRLAWGYRNLTSAWMERVRAQNTPEFVARAKDPVLYRTSGCRVSGQGFRRSGERDLRAKGPGKLDVSIRVLSSQTPTVENWFAELEQPVLSDWKAHCRWWESFWERSHIFVERCGDRPVELDQCRFTQIAQGSAAYRGHSEINPAENAFQLSQRYALERFAEACASRGPVPPPYNGSIFTMDMPTGVMGFDRPKEQPVSPDGRDWAELAFMWQNTRHPYWAMSARGDYDTILPGMQFVRDGLDVCRDRCRRIFGHDGAFIMEASWWHNVGVFNWEGVPQHLRYHFLATIETPSIMCDYFEHTRDRDFLENVLLPCADQFILFYELQFPKRDREGRMLMEPAATVETFQPVTNPNTEICGLRFLIGKLLTFDIGAERRQRWEELLQALPSLPLRRVRGMDLLAVGERYAPGREICESPEMYSVYPFRQAWLGTPSTLGMARQSFHVRTISLDGTADGQAVETGGWQAAPVQAACLGLAREAARLTSINFNDRFIHWTDNVDPQAPWPNRPRPRFPAFWEAKMDGTPDNDHGANSVNALQSMLLQSDGSRILLLPAWPEDWDVSFKLHAAANTTVECVYRGGKVRSIKVEPRSRLADVVDMSTPEQRIYTLVSVLCADRNFLFGLPPMLDGLPFSGATTRGWLAKYGKSVSGVRAAPWKGCVHRGNILYVHALEGLPVEPPVPLKVLSRKLLTGPDETPDKILKLEYDGSLEPFARTLVSAGSLTLGKQPDLGEVDLGEQSVFDRLEFTIENPDHRRGKGVRFQLQRKGSDGSWETIHEGQVFGLIYSKRFEPIRARWVRLQIAGHKPTQFDLFPPGK